MKQLFSLQKITAGLRSAISHYPFVIVMAVALATQSIGLIQQEDSQLFDELFPWMFAQGLGISLFFALHTFIRQKQLSKSLSALTLIAGVGLLTLIGYHFDYLSNNATEETMAIEIAALALASHLLVAFLPFFRKNTLHGFWQYNKSLFLRAFTTVLYTGVLFAGLSGAIAAIQELFDVEFTGKIFAYLWFIMAFPVSALIFCAGVPKAEDIDDLESSNDLPNGLRLFVQFVLLPLVVVYLCILYAYMGKIILAWTLPQGWVTLLIMVFSVLGMLAMLLIHPFQQITEHAWIKVITKNYYRALLPLLVLQYVAIFTRISDYGFTSARWAVVAITAWLTFIAVYKVFFKGKNIILIPSTLFIVAILFLVGPLSHHNISVWSQTAKINRLVTTLQLIDAKGKLKVYKPSAATDSLMGELYSASRYLNRNHECTGLEPHIHYPTESEILKEMSYSQNAQITAEMVVQAPEPATAEEAVAQKIKKDSVKEAVKNDTTSLVSTPNGAKKFDRYDRRSAIRSLLDAQFDKYGINNYERFNETSETTSINFESAQPQVFIPDGGWKKSFAVNDVYFYNNEYRLISDYVNMVKIKSNSNTEFTLLVDDEAFTVDLGNLIQKHMNTEDYYIKIPNNELVFRFKNNQTECALVLNKIRIERESDETNSSKVNSANRKVWKLNELNGTLYLK